MFLHTLASRRQLGVKMSVEVNGSIRSVPFPAEFRMKKLLAALLAGLFVLGAHASDKKEEKKDKEHKEQKKEKQ